jgi:hypothetical protein
LEQMSDRSSAISDLLKRKSVMTARTLAILILGCTFSATFVPSNPTSADSWGPPKLAMYLSSDSIYCFEVIPKDLDREYRERREKEKNRDDGSSSYDPSDNYCTGTLSKLGALRGYRRMWSIRLLNDVSPLHVLVSKSGNYVITFDNWASVGYGDNVVVIYGSNGEMIRKYALEDILDAAAIDRVPMSVSSRWWGGDHYLDEEREVLVLKVVRNMQWPLDEEAEFEHVEIDLKTGEFVIN